jgi:beta-lactamase regulating signal transducer with metallopeptidase domain
MRAAEVLWALAAVVPLSAAGLFAGAMLERAGVSAKVRERVWSLAFWLGPVAGGLALLADALPEPATAGITIVLRSTPLGALSRALGQAPHLGLPHAPEVLLGVAGLGAAFRLARLGRAWGSLRSLRRSARAAPAETVRAIRAAGLRASVPVKLSAGTSTPVAAGLFRPEILLPPRLAAPEAAALVCRHEAQHIGRLDNLRLILEQLAAALLWFDPLRGVLHRWLLSAREERCDAAALAGCTPDERELYARTLLEELMRAAGPALAVSLTGDGRSHAMTRLSAILDPRPDRRRPLLSLGLCGLLAAVAGGATWAAVGASQPTPNWVNKVVSVVAVIAPHPLQTARAEAAAQAPFRVAQARPPHGTMAEDGATPASTAPSTPTPNLKDLEGPGIEITVAGAPGDMDIETTQVGMVTEQTLGGPPPSTRTEPDGGVTVRYDTPVRVALHTKVARLLIDGQPAPADFDPEAAAGEWYRGVEIALGPQSLVADGRTGNTVRAINYLTRE